MKSVCFLALLLMSLFAHAQCPTSGTISANCTTIGNLTISGNTLTINNGVSVTVNGDLIFNNDAVINATGATLNISGDLLETYGGASNLNTFNGGTINLLNTTSDFRTGNGSSFTLTGATVNMNGGIITLNNATQTLTNSTFTGASTMSTNLDALIINNTSITTSGAMEIEDATISNGSSLSAGGILTVSSSSSVENSTINTGVNNASTTGQEGLEFNGGATFTFTNGSVMNVRGDLTDQRSMIIDASDVTITGNMVNDGGDNVEVRNGGTLTVQGNFTNSGGSSVQSDGGSVISVEGDFSNGGGSSVDTDGGVVIVGGSYSGDPPTGDGTGCTGGSGACCGSPGTCSTLPVSLVTFTAKSLQNEILLSWLTANEENNDFFSIEKSYDGNVFETIAVVKGNGTTTQVSQYQYKDSHTGTSGLYYRLTQTDFDGTSEILRLLYVEPYSSTAGYLIYPTKIAHEKVFNITITGEKTQRADLYLISVSGQKISGLNIIPADIGYRIDLSDKALKSGIYLLRGKIGEQEINGKIVLD